MRGAKEPGLFARADCMTVRAHEPATPDLRWIGRPHRRVEDDRFLRGHATFIDDVAPARLCHMVVARSPHGHARVARVNAAAARRASGVLAVITSDEIAGRVHPLPIDGAGATVAQIPLPPLAVGRVRFVGQPVAVVVAETRALAMDALVLLEIDYEPLPAVSDPRAALTSPSLHDGVPDNVLLRWSRKTGAVDEAFRSARHVVKGTFRLPRLAAAPIEPRGAVAAYDRGTDLLTMWCSAQDPHRPRLQLSRLLGRPDDRIRIIVPDVGGGFGSKGALAPEAAVAGIAAMDLDRPVKWIEDRRDNLSTAYQGRGVDADVEMAVDGDGRVHSVRARVIADVGAYLYPSTPVPATMAASLLTGAYTIPSADVELVGVATNKVPTGPYRGAGRPEAAYAVERMMDLVAHTVGIDPVEVRRRNLISRDRFPYRTPLGLVYDSGDYERALDHAVRLLERDAVWEERLRAKALGRLMGVGLAVYVERAGGGWESAGVVVNPSGRVIVRPGSKSIGQGLDTAFAQIAADLLQVHIHTIVVEHGDSATAPRGMGTFASRSTAVGGSALVLALEQIKTKATKIAAHLLEASVEDIAWDGGRLSVRGSAGRAVTLPQVAAAAYDPSRLPRDVDMGLHAIGHYVAPSPVFPFGVYAAVVEIDPDTGYVDVRRVIAVDDAGRIVNPLTAEGQVLGSTAQGIGEALLEEVVYDEGGQLATATLADYALPRATNVPPVTSVFLETPSPINPLGAKGIGESGSIGTPAAIANAVADAVAPLGIRHIDPPYTSAKLWRAIDAARRATG
jgi:aerobic carbon-monoxide dehydrogenase large subunit